MPGLSMVHFWNSIFTSNEPKNDFDQCDQSRGFVFDGISHVKVTDMSFVGG